MRDPRSAMEDVTMRMGDAYDYGGTKIALKLKARHIQIHHEKAKARPALDGEKMKGLRMSINHLR